jgi:hypothetical protein
MIAALGLFATATPAAAADRVAIVGCDLLTQGGPTAIFRQLAGEDDDDDRSGFVFQDQTGFQSGGSNSSNVDVTGRSCAEVLADLANESFEFRSSEVSGRQLILLWEAN